MPLDHRSGGIFFVDNGAFRQICNNVGMFSNLPDGIS